MIEQQQDIQWSIGAILEKWAIRKPDKPALIIDGKTLTYAQMNARANQFAHYFLACGLVHGDRIAALGFNSIDNVCCYFAAAKLGLVAVPLNNRLMGRELHYQLDNAGCKLVAFDAAFQDNLQNGIEGLDFPASRLLCFDGARDWFTSTAEAVAAQPDDNPKSNVYLHDPLAIIYTSGTTGAPKGAVTTHLQTYFKCFQVMLYLDMRSDDIMYTPLPLFHSAGLFISLTPTIARGATIVASRQFDPQRMIDEVVEHKVTVAGAITSMWKMILKLYDKQANPFSNLRLVFGGGERTPRSLIEELKALDISMIMGFGQTENSFMAMQDEAHILSHFGEVGRAGFFTDIWIGDEAGNPQSAGEVGRVLARGPTVMSGYWNMPEKTAETIKDGVLNTGDLGYMDAEGHLYLVDREKDMYRSGGENVYPAEIEKLLMDHPAIDNAAVIGVADDDWGEVGKAFLVLHEGATLSADDIPAYLEGKLARYKYPKHYEFIDELPVTETGKVKKVELKKREMK